MFWTGIEEVERMFEPLRELERMSWTLPRLAATRSYDLPAVNVWEGAEEAVVTTELPGINPADVEITVKGRSLILKGSRKAEELKEGEYFHRRERWSGDFDKTIELPFEVEADKVSAKYAKGVLTVRVPRAESEKPRKIAISSE